MERPVARMVNVIRGLDGARAASEAARLPASLAGCPVHDLKERLRDAGLRPTRQRVALGWLLFGRGDRHLAAETLFEEAQRARVPVSLATVYNTLNQFTQAGLLREIAVDGGRTYFDTNTSDHHHFFVEGGDTLVDIPGHDLAVNNLPEPPEGMEIARVEVVVRLRRKAS
ncbi:iron response transcriptional regulator IrrA [Rhabdaerophilum sp. SD176]|uniref:iron response transcriptional regulator IrrA n=1 Tax=Rhabdaerophilum sp. SD176 TaxID=2983548 RepID=UPI0024DFA885|nr:Fur family transcriptional regulator [Rhabdaerophilum sp. SD176]